jgi:hypothetical protein
MNMNSAWKENVQWDPILCGAALTNKICNAASAA